MADEIMARYWAMPPVARTIATTAFACSVAVHFGFISPYHFYYAPYLMKTMPPQLWRYVTCFLITGPQVGILFDTYFLYNSLWQLEKSHPRLSKTPDLIWYLIIITGFIQLLSHLSGFVYPQLLPALNVALCYTATQEQRGARTNYMLFDIPTQTMPFAMMLVSLFMGGPALVIHELHGLIAAHLFLFLSSIVPDIAGGWNIVSTPAIMSRLVERFGAASASASASASAGPGSGAGMGMGTGAGRAQGQARGSAERGSGPLPDSWRTRGPGHRLG